MKIDNVDKALQVFSDSAIEHAKATAEGDHIIANNNHDLIVLSAKYLRQKNLIRELSKFFNHDNIGVRIWAATFSLEENENKAKEILKEISQKHIAHHSFTAEMTLEEWNCGNLKLPYE